MDAAERVLKDSRGVPTTTKLPDKEFKVSVSIHTGKTTIAVIKPAHVDFGRIRGTGRRVHARRLVAKALRHAQGVRLVQLTRSPSSVRRITSA
jgi:hypothetical protein